MTEQRGNRKVREGVVITNAMNKTVIADVGRRVLHPLYKRVIKRNKQFMVHDEKNECGVGDIIEIMETRPLSKRKRWRLVKILKKAK
jgi:small subunit ribosomal protein S17